MPVPDIGVGHATLTMVGFGTGRAGDLHVPLQADRDMYELWPARGPVSRGHDDGIGDLVRFEGGEALTRDGTLV